MILNLLTSLLHFRLKVSHEKFFLHYIDPTHFVDSPEFEAVPPNDEDNDTFQVRLKHEYFICKDIIAPQSYFKDIIVLRSSDYCLQ